MDVFSTNFATIDWIIVMVYICIPVVIGVIVRKYVRQLSDFIWASFMAFPRFMWESSRLHASLPSG